MKIETYTTKYAGWLSDESRHQGQAEMICFPESFEDVKAALDYARAQGLKIKVQGARTGLMGAAVPQGGLILDCSGINKLCLEGMNLYAEAGVSLEQIHRLLLKTPYCFKPEPSEKAALLGGMFGENATGLNGKPFAAFVKKLWWITGTGEILEIVRGKYFFDSQGHCPLPNGACLTWPPEKTAGFSVPSPGEDLIDILSGQEGRLGMALAFELTLSQKPICTWGVFYFMPTEQDAVDFAEQLLTSNSRAALEVLEFYDNASLRCLEANRKKLQELKEVSAFPEEAGAALYMEISGDAPEVLEPLLFEQLDLFEAAGGSEDFTWAADEPLAVEKFQRIRHCLMTLANEHIDEKRHTFPEMTRLSSDLKGPAKNFGDYLAMYRMQLKATGLETLIFGSFLTNVLHVIAFPENTEFLKTWTASTERWAAQAVADNGLVITENGLGQAKAALANKLIPETIKAKYRALKAVFDPEGLFQ